MRYSIAVLAATLGVMLTQALAGQASSNLVVRLSDDADGVAPSLSPDGAIAALVSWNAAGSELIAHTFASGDRRTVLRYEEQRLRSCAWKTNAQLVCVVADDRGGRKLLVAALDGSTVRELGDARHLLDVLPDDAERVVVERSGKWGHLYLASGKFRSYADGSTARQVGELYRSRSDLGTAQGVIDGTGTLRVRPGHSAWLVLPALDGPWVVWHPYEYSGIDLFEPVAFDERSDEVLFLDTHDNRTALFALSVRGRRAERLVLAPPFAYVVAIERLGKYPRPANAVVFDGQVRTEPIDPLVARVHETVRNAFPDDVINVFDEDWNQRYYLVRVTDRAGAGQYFRFDSVEERLDDLAPTRQGAVTKVSAPRTRLEFESAGGRKAVAYVTSPRGAASPWPIVVLPAGATNFADQLVPFLAASGYAVLELPVPQALSNAAGIDLQASTEDIGPAIEALAGTHSVDTTRACAVGIEYGAYVALVHAAQDSALLRCVVGIETIVNPEWHEARSLLFEGPPMSASVLLMSGLAMSGVPRLNKELQGAGVDVELVEYPSRQYEIAAVRDAFYKKLSEFLGRHLR